MSTIRRATGEHTALIQQMQQASQAAEAGPVKKAGPALPGDGVETLRRTTSKLTQPTASPLPPPAPPATPQLEAVAAAAQAFSGNLSEMGGRFGSSEEMLLAFLKLQMLESSRTNNDTGLSQAGRSHLLAGALASIKNGDLGLAAQRRAEAEQHDQAAQGHKSQGDAVLREAGVDPAEVEAMARETMQAGGTSADVLERYAEAHKDDPKLDEKLDALRASEPHYMLAMQSSQAADRLRGVAGGMEGTWMMGSFLSNSVRSGTEGLSAVLANEEAQKKLANELVAILSGQAPGAEAKDEAMRKMEEARQIVVELLQEVTEKADSLKTSALSAALRG